MSGGSKWFRRVPFESRFCTSSGGCIGAILVTHRMGRDEGHSSHSGVFVHERSLANRVDGAPGMSRSVGSSPVGLGDD